ncbi:MAG: archease [Verrucomicrobiia bacterium]
MTDRFEFFDHTADIGVRVYGSSLVKLFENAARAMHEALGRLHKPESNLRKSIDLQAESIEDLLHDWLADLLYEIEVNHILYDEFEIHELTPHRLKAVLRGGPIDFAHSQTNEEIKAVTYHQLRVESQPDGSWRATVIFDV